MDDEGKIGAVVLAAGLSTRMGRPKMVLPWKDTTVIGQVVRTLRESGVRHIVVVTGGARELVEAALEGEPVKTSYNPDFANGEMLVSLQTGIKALPPDLTGTLVVLGDQPRMQVDTIHRVITEGKNHPGKLVVPSFQMRRGHPWLAPSALWPELLKLNPPAILRDFNQAHENEMVYVTVDTDTVLRDMDTPDDYEKEKQRT